MRPEEMNSQLSPPAGCRSVQFNRKKNLSNVGRATVHAEFGLSSTPNVVGTVADPALFESNFSPLQLSGIWKAEDGPASTQHHDYLTFSPAISMTTMYHSI